MSAVAECRECGATFTEPAAAAEHWRDTAHQPWSIPSSWMVGRPWGLAALMRSVLAELER